MRIRFKLNYKYADPLLNISISASYDEISELHDAISVVSGKSVDNLSHALGVMVGKEDFEVKD